MSDEAVRGFKAYEKRKPAELTALTEDDVVKMEAQNADAAKHNAQLFQAAQAIAEDIDPTNREIRSLTPPDPPALLAEWRALQQAVQEKTSDG